MMTEMLKGKSRREAETLFAAMHDACTGHGLENAAIDADDAERIKALAGVRHYPMRVKCATLPWHTLQAALGEDGARKVSTEGDGQT